MNNRSKTNKYFSQKKTNFELKTTAGLKGAAKDLDRYIFTLPSKIRGFRQDMFNLIIDKLKDYIFKEYTGAKFCLTILNMHLKSVIPKPKEPESQYSLTDQELWNLECKQYLRYIELQRDVEMKMYIIVKSQVLEILLDKLKQLPNYNDFDSNYNLVELLISLQMLFYQP